MTLPEKIRIGVIDYAIKEYSDLHQFDSEDRRQWLNGQIMFQSCVIKVEHDATDQRKAVTVVHEALHGILEQAGVIEHPEPILIALGFGVVSLIQNNPALVQMIVDSAPKEEPGEAETVV